MGFVARVCQPSTLRMLICPDASNAQNNIAAVSADGSTVWVLMRRLNSSCRRSISLAGGEAREGEQTMAGFLQAVGNGAMLQPPFADEGLAASGDLLRCRRIDHVVVVGGDLLMQTFGRVGQKVPVLVDRAALHRVRPPK